MSAPTAGQQPPLQAHTDTGGDRRWTDTPHVPGEDFLERVYEILQAAPKLGPDMSRAEHMAVLRRHVQRTAGPAWSAAFATGAAWAGQMAADRSQILIPEGLLDLARDQVYAHACSGPDDCHTCRTVTQLPPPIVRWIVGE